MKLHIHGNDGRNTVYTGISGESGRETSEKIFLLAKSLTDVPFRLAAFETDDWNGELSPWEAGAVFGDEGFSGKGRETLSRLTGSIIPGTEKDCAAENRFIAGYSLSGLFSLWAFYESGTFRGAASCSGSLWFPGWKEYMSAKTAVKNSIVYLSLGKKEELVRNAVMSEVGNNTRYCAKLLEKDENIAACTLEWNAGGHFKDMELRTAKGIAWLLNNAKDGNE